MDLFRKALSHKKAGNGRDLARRDYGLLIAEDIILGTLLAWVFYDSVYGLIVVIPVGCMNHFRYLGQKKSEWERRFSLELSELLSELVSSLQIGYSVERAFEEVERSLRSLHGDESIFTEELYELNQKVRMRQPVEQAFLEMADRYGQEELLAFAEVFRFAKRLGGNYIENIKRCAAKIKSRLEIEAAIRLAVAEKQLELKIMMAMPLGVLLYMKLSSPEFMAGIYHNLMGISVMTGCLLVYAGAIVLGKRIIDIKV